MDHFDFGDIQNPQQPYSTVYYAQPAQIPMQTENLQTSNIPYATPVYSNQVMPNQWNAEYFNQYPPQTSPVSTPTEGQTPKDDKKTSTVTENIKEVGSKVVSGMDLSGEFGSLPADGIRPLAAAGGSIRRG